MMDIKRVCEECGKEFIGHAYTAKYCSTTCKSRAAYKRDKEYRALVKAFAARRLATVASERRVRRCKGCVWRSWVDHTKCVMPTCLAGLGAVNDRG